ncbi:putative reverse transcriptase zinc-binding domain-containing protein [Helianthus annuus]|nr:putative reverse transcriptase zinc-binding domain-containing protein [Helianthus annuus]
MHNSKVFLWEWNRAPSIPMELDERQRLELFLQSVSLEDTNDGWVWFNGREDDFSVASVKRWMRGSNNEAVTFGFKWSKWVPTKCNIFMWRAYLDRLPTKTALIKRRIMIENNICDWCESNEETIEHILTGCAFSMGVWTAITTWCKVPRSFVFHVKDLVEMQDYSGVSGNKKEVLHGVIIITCWCLWRARNDKVFSNKMPNVTDLVADIKGLFGSLLTIIQMLPLNGLKPLNE